MIYCSKIFQEKQDKMLSHIQNFQATEYPKLYRDTYWGWSGHIDLFANETIIKNRNTFAAEYQLKKRLQSIPKKYIEKEVVLSDLTAIEDLKKQFPRAHIRYDEILTHDLRDHIEYYKTEYNTIVVIFSSYDESDSYTNMVVNCGYSMIPKLYNKQANTFIKEII